MRTEIEYTAFEIGDEVTIAYTKPQKGTVVEVYLITQINNETTKSIVDAYCVDTPKGRRFVSATQVKGVENDSE